MHMYVMHVQPQHARRAQSPKSRAAPRATHEEARAAGTENSTTTKTMSLESLDESASLLGDNGAKQPAGRGVKVPVDLQGLHFVRLIGAMHVVAFHFARIHLKSRDGFGPFQRALSFQRKHLRLRWCNTSLHFNVSPLPRRRQEVHSCNVVNVVSPHPILSAVQFFRLGMQHARPISLMQ